MALCETYACTLSRYRNVDFYYLKIVFGAMNLSCICAFLHRLNSVVRIKNNVVSLCVRSGSIIQAVIYRRTEL